MNWLRKRLTAFNSPAYAGHWSVFCPSCRQSYKWPTISRGGLHDVTIQIWRQSDNNSYSDDEVNFDDNCQYTVVIRRRVCQLLITSSNRSNHSQTLPGDFIVPSVLMYMYLVPVNRRPGLRLLCAPRGSCAVKCWFWWCYVLMLMVPVMNGMHDAQKVT